jgi:RNA polymerase sigma factor (TIGR02999 family)
VTEITSLLKAVEPGEPQAAAQLLHLVYDDLRRLAAHRLAHEAPGLTLEPTALVHEAYLRVVGTTPDRSWDSRGHFFAAAAEAMRRIPVENARRKRAVKHGAGLVRRELEEADVSMPEPREDLLALDEGLTELATVDRPAAELVQLRYFGGLSIPEAAEVLGLSPRTADRLWSYARAWLHCKVSGGGRDTNPD